MKAKVVLTVPTPTEYVITLSPREAELLVKFLGPTTIKLVESILPAVSEVTLQETNALLGNLFNVLLDAGIEVDY